MHQPFWRDLETAARSLARRPVFLALNLTLLVITSAAVTAIFAVISATLLRPLPCIVALLLVAAGVYGLTLFLVLTRTREFGVRSALGASPQNILMTASFEGMTPVIAGAVIGIVASYPAFRLIQRWIKIPYDQADVPYIVLSIAVLLAVAALAALIPARRASKISPAVALRAG